MNGRNCQNQNPCTVKTCGNRGRSPLPADIAEAMAYVPFQQWQSPYCIETALCKGTVFPVLDNPFLGGRCK